MLEQTPNTPVHGSDPTHYRDMEALGDRIAELSALISAATFHLLTLIREFDERGGWACGFRSCAHWLSWRTGLSMGPAREKVRVARALADLPKISEAIRQGEIPYSKVRALTRIATPETEERLLVFSRAGTVSHVERLVRAWRTLDRDEEREEEAERHASRYLDTYVDDDGMVVVRGRLDPEAGAAFQRALEAASQVLYDEESESPTPSYDRIPVAQRRADAVGRMAEAALAGGFDQGTRGDRYQVVVHVDAEVLVEENGPPVSGDPELPANPDPLEIPALSEIEGVGNVSRDGSRRIACDASKVVMTHDHEGGILDVGRKTRVISPALRRALTYRDGGCRFPGCGLKFCDAHHVKHWADGGETNLHNTLLVCRTHHRYVHEEGYRVERTEDGVFRFFRPDGQEVPEVPAPGMPALGGPRAPS